MAAMNTEAARAAAATCMAILEGGCCCCCRFRLCFAVAALSSAGWGAKFDCSTRLALHPGSQSSLSQFDVRPWSQFVRQLSDAQTLPHRIGQPPHWLKALRQLQASRDPPDAAQPSRAATGRLNCSDPMQPSLPLEAAATHDRLARTGPSARTGPPAATTAVPAEPGQAEALSAGGEAAAAGLEVAADAADADQAASADDASGISPAVTPQQQRPAGNTSRYRRRTFMPAASQRS